MARLRNNLVGSRHKQEQVMISLLAFSTLYLIRRLRWTCRILWLTQKQYSLMELERSSPHQSRRVMWSRRETSPSRRVSSVKCFLKSFTILNFMIWSCWLNPKMLLRFALICITNRHMLRSQSTREPNASRLKLNLEITLSR
jgi:hypothetical protein